ncbi:hypothetical protein NC652_001504 [Populus alba x Populus x berolinensis]|nr:hypothetical protein NC652_001504 [Populus alba x Populus x berolinensis]
MSPMTEQRSVFFLLMLMHATTCQGYAVAENCSIQANQTNSPANTTQIHSSKFLHKLQTIYKEHPFFHPLTSSMIKHRIHYCNENLTHKRFSVDENGSLVHNK